VVFIPHKTAQTIFKARSDQDNDEQTGGTPRKEDDKQEEDEKVGDKQLSAETSAISKKGEELKKTRERLALLKANISKKTKDNPDEEEKLPAEPEQEIVVKDEYIASGSRDKRIKIWSAKRGT